MGELDIAAKALLREEPRALIELALPGRKIVKIEHDETELQASERRMDKLLRVEVAGEPGPIWIHVEIEAVWAADVPERVFDYWSLARRERKPLRSLVLVLRPGRKQGEPVGLVERSVLGRRVLRFEFDVICMWKLEAEEILARGETGLLPFIAFAKGATIERTEEALHVLESRRPSDDALAAHVVFSTRVFPEEDWLAKMSEESRMDRTFVKEFKAIFGPMYDALLERRILARMLRRRLGKGKRTEALVARLRLCDNAALKKIGDLLVGSMEKVDLVTAIERVVPKAAEK